jgi:hypothetical protein
MQLNVLLLPVLGGFLFLSIFHRSAYFLARQNVATLTFWLAVTGLALLAIARLAVMMCQFATKGPGICCTAFVHSVGTTPQPHGR